MENINEDVKNISVKIRQGFVTPGYAAWVPFRRTIIYNKNVDVTRRLIAHELVHVVQHERYGLMFYPRYFWGWVRAGFDYFYIPMEMEARKGEKESFYLSWAEELMRKHGLL